MCGPRCGLRLGNMPVVERGSEPGPGAAGIVMGVTSNLDRLPPLVVCDRWRWQSLWFAVALALPVACGVVILVALAMYETR